MSTRCQIQVKGSPILIYKHSDGYPEGVLPVLEPFAKAFSESRGNDVDYCLAQIVRTFALADAKEDAAWAKRTERTMTFKTPNFIGWGIDCEIHGDIEYFYVVDAAKGTVEVQERDFHLVTS